MKGLTIQYLPHQEIINLDSERRVNKILDIVKKNKVVLMQGKLRSYEESMLIQRTMELVSKEFKGIELCTLYPQTKEKPLFQVIKSFLAKLLIGNIDGVTIIGPASIIKEIKRNPNKIELMMYNVSKKGRRR